MARLLDRYEHKARLVPAMLVALPAALVLATIGQAANRAALGAAAAVLVEFGVPIAMANYTRMAGKHIEPDLWETWGGVPTTQLLRHRSATNPHRLAIVHAQLAVLVPELPMPTAPDEDASPADSDRRWDAIAEAACSRLRDLPSSRLLFEENCSYGFHRNMLGLRPVGIRAAVAAGAIATIGAIVQLGAQTSPALMLLSGAGGYLAAWGWHRLGPTYARQAAFSYAEAFVGAILGSRDAGSPATAGG